MTRVGDRRLFHFTHLGNLSDILADKRLVSDTVMQARGGVPVEAGDKSIKAGRRTRRISPAPHGSPADYVPFYFAPRSPMLYVINKGNVPTYREGQRPLIYFVTTVEDAATAGQPWVYSDGNCAAEITRHFTDLSMMDQVVDWDVIRAEIWANTKDDGDRMRRRAAEFLVYEHLPVTAIREIGTYDHEYAQRTLHLLRGAGVELNVTVRREWYY